LLAEQKQTALSGPEDSGNNMARIILNARVWWPALFRAMLLCTLAYLVAFDSNFDQMVAKLIDADTSKWGFARWAVALYPIFGKPIIAAMIALKGFMDDSWGKTKREGDTAFLTKGDVK
jgi:hypothetical protein